MRVEIDEHSGFCFGVVNAIRKAEQELERGMLYCIGDIVHNDLEVERLRLRGLKTIEHEQFARLQHCRVLFRAHGEPPVSYEIAQKNEVEVIDASCPVVLNLQKRIRKAYEQLKDRNIVFITMMMDTEREQWIRDMKREEIGWLCLTDLKGMKKSPLVDAYNLRGLPDSFVVDPEGYIIRRDLRGGEVLDYLSEVVTEYQNEF